MQTITERGLRRHLDEKVFVAESEFEIEELLCANKGPARAGFLREANIIYIQVCKRRVSGAELEWIETSKKYGLENGNTIRLRHKQNKWKNYEVKLK